MGLMEESRMKQSIVLIIAIGCAACAHKTPVSQNLPKDPTPVATASAPAAAKPAAQRTVAASQPRQSALQSNNPKVMPPDVRKQLNDLLARMEDALFDYDKS